MSLAHPATRPARARLTWRALSQLVKSRGEKEKACDRARDAWVAMKGEVEKQEVRPAPARPRAPPKYALCVVNGGSQSRRRWDRCQTLETELRELRMERATLKADVEVLCAGRSVCMPSSSASPRARMPAFLARENTCALRLRIAHAQDSVLSADNWRVHAGPEVEDMVKCVLPHSGNPHLRLGPLRGEGSCCILNAHVRAHASVHVLTRGRAPIMPRRYLEQENVRWKSEALNLRREVRALRGPWLMSIPTRAAHVENADTHTQQALPSRQNLDFDVVVFWSNGITSPP